MRRRLPLLGLLLVLALLVAGVTVLFRLRLAHGDVFPAYSSLRSDPLGTRALHDALTRTSGLRIERSFKPLSATHAQPLRTLILAGAEPESWQNLARETLDALDDFAQSGGRLVIALRARGESAPEMRDEREKPETKDEAAGRDRERHLETLRRADVARRWGATTRAADAPPERGVARRDRNERSAELPDAVTWFGRAHFTLEPDAGWQVIYRRGEDPVLIERRRGRGSIVVAGDSYFLSNEGLLSDRAPALLTWLVGPHRRVTFDEAHLGVQANPGIAALARRYGLEGAFFTLLVLAVLFVWRQTASFVPAAAEPEDVGLTYHPAAGLEALLRRSVPSQEIVATCVNEWKATARSSEHGRVDAALAALPKNANTVARYNAIVGALRRRR